MLRPFFLAALVFGFARSSVAQPSPAGAPPSPAPRLSQAGVVVIEQAGRVVALGTLLNGDGRIVTALSRLVVPGQIFVRFENGNLLSARVGHSDASRDIALLVPRSGRWVNGVKASRSTPLPGARVTAFALEKNRAVTPTEQTLASSAQVQGRVVWKLAREPKLTELGGPVLDERGDAVAITVGGCLPSAPTPCSQPSAALPVGDVRAFLRELPATASFPVPRLGVRGVSIDAGRVRGLRITEVEPGSPAAALRLRATSDPDADILVAVAGTPVASEPALNRALVQHAPGERVELLVFGPAGYRTLGVQLGEAPLGTPTKPAAAAPAAKPAAGVAPAAKPAAAAPQTKPAAAAAPAPGPEKPTPSEPKQ